MADLNEVFCSIIFKELKTDKKRKKVKCLKCGWRGFRDDLIDSLKSANPSLKEIKICPKCKSDYVSEC